MTTIHDPKVYPGGAGAQTMATMEHPAPKAGTDDLSERYGTSRAEGRDRATCHQLALLRFWLEDVRAERALREARLALTCEGKNDTERRARQRLAIACDADLRRLDEDERRARTRLVEVEAELTVLRWRVQACLAMLRAPGMAGVGAGSDHDLEA